MNNDFSIGDKQLAAIAKYADNGIMLLTPEGLVEWANEGCKRLYGYIPKTGESYFEDANTNFIKHLNSTDSSFFINHASLSFSRSIYTKDDIRKWIQSTVTPIKNTNGIIELFIVIETDITQQKEVEEALIQQQENTQTLTEHLESVNNYVEEKINELNVQKKALELAKERSEDVLNKVLPYEVAIQLKKKGYASPRHYKMVTVINISFRNFFKLADILPLEQLVEEYHQCLVKIDCILESHYVEKIKTAGDSYIGAGGVPLRNRSNPIDVVLSALEVKRYMEQFNLKREKQGQPPFIIGIGVHTGKVIAGVVGKNKLSYDIWGDAVNIAATIERNSDVNKIIISDTTLNEIIKYFDYLSFNNLILSNADNILLYEITGLKEKYSDDPEKTKPNITFTQILTKL
jgi:PAS domain S-box-containing protein